MIGGDGNDDGALCAAGMAAVAGEAKVRAVQLGADPDATDDTCRAVACLASSWHVLLYGQLKDRMSLLGT